MANGNPNLTKILFAGLLITFITAVLLTQYSAFTVLNDSEIEEPYKSIFENISASYTELSGVANTVKDEGIVKNILNFGENLATGTVNVFVTGLEAMGTFFEMIPIWGDIISAISLGLPQLSGLFSLLILMFGVYIAMRYIQSVSNKNDLP